VRLELPILALNRESDNVAWRVSMSNSLSGDEFETHRGKQSFAVAVHGPLVVDEVELVIRAALDGVGLAYLGEDRAAPHLARGALVRVLEPWCQPFPGFFLYYPSRRQQPAALSALIDMLRM
jgi:DNA-binding transcriptional LysR family regulator